MLITAAWLFLVLLAYLVGFREGRHEERTNRQLGQLGAIPNPPDAARCTDPDCPLAGLEHGSPWHPRTP